MELGGYHKNSCIALDYSIPHEKQAMTCCVQYCIVYSIMEVLNKLITHKQTNKQTIIVRSKLQTKHEAYIHNEDRNKRDMS